MNSRDLLDLIWIVPALPILGAVRAGATVGEISGALRAVWGEHREALVL